MKKITFVILIFFVLFSFGQTPVYQFNFDNSLANTTNSVLLQNNGTTETYTNDRFGTPNSAIQFSSSNYLNSTTMSNLPSGSSPFSVSFWVKYTATGASSTVFWGTNSNNQGLAIRELVQNSSNTSSNLLVSGGGGINVSHNVNHFTFTNQWYFYTITHSPTVGTTNPITKIYRDGVLIKSQNVAERNIVLNNAFTLGALQSTSSVAQMNAALDDFRVYDLALTDSEVQNLYSSSGLPSVLPPTISAIGTSNLTPNSATVNYTIQTNGASSSTVIKYGISATSLNMTFTAPLTTSSSASYNEVISGLNPATQYFYRIESINSGGTNFSAVNSFTTAANASVVQNGLVAYYSFENDFNSHNSLHELLPSSSIPLRNLMSGKYGNGVNFSSVNQQELVNNSSLNSVIDGSEFTISYWVNSTANIGGLQNPSHFVMFGSGFIRQQPSSSYQSLFRGYAQGASNFRTLTDTNSAGLGQWQHITVVHKAGTTNAREFEVYVNGVQLSSFVPQATIQSLFKIDPNFYLGGGGNSSTFFNGSIDELYLYNRALNLTEINYIKDYYDSALSTISLSKSKFNLYPNPANDIVSISLDDELKSVEIYSLQGHKVLATTNKEFNVSQLNSGIYLVKVEDVSGNVSTQKMIKK